MNGREVSRRFRWDCDENVEDVPTAVRINEFLDASAFTFRCRHVCDPAVFYTETTAVVLGDAMCKRVREMRAAMEMRRYSASVTQAGPHASVHTPRTLLSPGTLSLAIAFKRHLVTRINTSSVISYLSSLISRERRVSRARLRPRSHYSVLPPTLRLDIYSYSFQLTPFLLPAHHTQDLKPRLFRLYYRILYSSFFDPQTLDRSALDCPLVGVSATGKERGQYNMMFHSNLLFFIHANRLSSAVSS